MNNILRLKGRYSTASAQRPGAPTLPARAKVTTVDIESKIAQLREVKAFWEKQTIPIDPLVEVHYITVVAKSNRIKRLLAGGKRTPNDAIVGADFESKGTHNRHVITYYVPMSVIDSTIADLEASKTILEHHGGSIDAKGLGDLTGEGLTEADKNAGLSKTAFAQIIRDVHFVDRFDVKAHANIGEERSLVTIYDTGRTESQTVDLLQSLGIDIIAARLLDSTTINMDPKQYRKLEQEAPYLIAMSTKDMSELEIESGVADDVDAGLSIPSPNNEPVVGVIDTRFDKEHAYFSEWVEYRDKNEYIKPELGDDPEDYIHGTEVTSLIVDGPTLNPKLNDGCGHFRVRHFAVAKSGRNSSFTIIKSIRKIVSENQDIVVWNLSLGSVLETLENTISPEAALLDELQNEYGVIFIVAGTNKVKGDDPDVPKRVGAPADSINSLVVNATSILREPASYTREGPVLRFFRKPDISCFGGDETEQMVVYGPNGITLTQGTSFAAPWITRKMAYLIHIMNFSRETAKALLIDSASGWQKVPAENIKTGYGIVPTRIDDVLTTPSNEIRFILEGTIRTFEASNLSIPVPNVNGKYPYMARATLCYFPKCNKNQGVDYTSTELDFHFGRVGERKINSLDNNIQDDPNARVFEEDERKLYRKWDNVKQVSDVEKSRFVARVVQGKGTWGFKIRKVERFDPPVDENDVIVRNAGDGLRFGIVVTLRGMDRRNHFEEFKRNCQFQSEPWIVEEIDMHTNIDLYNEAEVEIDFED